MRASVGSVLVRHTEQGRVLDRGGSCCRCGDGDEGSYGKGVVKTPLTNSSTTKLHSMRPFQNFVVVRMFTLRDFTCFSSTY